MRIFLKGASNNFIHLSTLRSSRQTDTVTIMVHGLYGLSGDQDSKSLLLGRKLTENNISNVLFFSSSRNWNIYQENDWDRAKSAFEGKSFMQERQDLLDTYDLVLKSGKNLFSNLKDEPIKVNFVANSVGGTIISSLLGEMKNVQKVVLCGSGIGNRSESKPILSTYPSQKYVKDSVEKYRGELLFLQGSEDSVVPKEAQQELYDSYAEARKKIFRVVEGADHSFSNSDPHSNRPYRIVYADEILNFSVIN